VRAKPTKLQSTTRRPSAESEPTKRNPAESHVPTIPNSPRLTLPPCMQAYSSTQIPTPLTQPTPTFLRHNGSPAFLAHNPVHSSRSGPSSVPEVEHPARAPNLTPDNFYAFDFFLHVRPRLRVDRARPGLWEWLLRLCGCVRCSTAIGIDCGQWVDGGIVCWVGLKDFVILSRWGRLGRAGNGRFDIDSLLISRMGRGMDY